MLISTLFSRSMRTRTRRTLNLAAWGLAITGSVAWTAAPRVAHSTGAPDLSQIKLAYTCGNYFRIRNSNSSQVSLTYTVYRTGEQGAVVLPGKPSAYPYSETYVQTSTTGPLQLFYNAGRVAVKDNGGLACANVATMGSWTQPFTWPIVGIHLTLLPTGQVLTWARLELGEEPYLWDPGSGTFTQVPLAANLFCAGQTLDANGRMIECGGHIDNNKGTRTSYTFDPVGQTWSQNANMVKGRWYPTVLALPDRTVMVIAGTDSLAQYNPVPEVLQGDGTWRELTNAQIGLPYYPWMFVAPNGKLFYAGETPFTEFMTFQGTGSWTGDTIVRDTINRDYGSAVMYAQGKILVMGGGHTTNTAMVINLNQASPTWRQVASMQYPRRHLSATILADGEVLVTGGSAGPDFNPSTNLVYAGEIWNPATEQWRTVASAHVERVYHGSALLLPDGRVLKAGSGQPNGVGLNAQFNAELYSPPYLYNPDGTPITASRPVITSAPASVTYGQHFQVQTENVIASTVFWVRLGADTHAFNESQRVNYLSFSQTNTTVNVIAAPNANLAPPGPYLLFILNANNVPSVGQVITVH